MAVEGNTDRRPRRVSAGKCTTYEGKEKNSVDGNGVDCGDANSFLKKKNCFLGWEMREGVWYTKNN